MGADLGIDDAPFPAATSRALQGAGHVAFGVGFLKPGEADRNPRLDITLMLDPLLDLGPGQVSLGGSDGAASGTGVAAVAARS